MKYMIIRRYYEMKKQKKLFIYLIIITIIFIAVALGILNYYNLIPKKSYNAEHFGIDTIVSEKDYNGNGIDDYRDILLGARADAENKPDYKSNYYAGGYPPEGEGVCTDVIWRAFQNAGYSLKDLVDEHIGENIDLYPRVEGNPDKNIDFRRVPNLKVYFDHNAVSCSLDPNDIKEWQPGDIVIFGKNYRHIAIVSDKRNHKGITYIIHNAGQPNREEDALLDWERGIGITGHYRFE